MLTLFCVLSVELMKRQKNTYILIHKILSIFDCYHLQPFGKIDRALHHLHHLLTLVSTVTSVFTRLKFEHDVHCQSSTNTSLIMLGISECTGWHHWCSLPGDFLKQKQTRSELCVSKSDSILGPSYQSTSAGGESAWLQTHGRHDFFTNAEYWHICLLPFQV